MSPLTRLLFAAAALHVTIAASIPEPGSKLIADLTPELENPPSKDTALEDITIEQTNVEDVNNELRAKPEDIPVEVVIEDSRPAIKTNEVADDDDEEIKRPSIDLRNPGPPQRQEHETQSADHFSSAQEKLLSVSETIQQTRDLLQKGIQGVGDDISHWLSTNEQMNTIQQNIQSLRDAFNVQIQKLNEITKNLAAPQALKTEGISEQDQAQSQPDIKEVENRIKILENNFNNGVRALSEGVNIVAILRADENGEVAEPAPAPAPAPAQPAPTEKPATAPDQNILFTYISNLQHTISDSVTNMTQALANNFPVFSNYLNPTQSSSPPPGVQADAPEGTTRQPANIPFTNIPLPNFPNLLSGLRPQGEQAQNPPAVPGPIASWVQNIQTLIQNGFPRPGASPATNSSATGSNVVPQSPAGEKQPETPAATASAAAAPPAPTGPIREILSNSPVVQSIAGTVQRIQSSITNPERPRDTEKKDELQTKGHYGGNKPGASGDSGSSSGLKEQSTDLIKQEVTLEETNKPEDVKTPEVVLEKTE